MTPEQIQNLVDQEVARRQLDKRLFPPETWWQNTLRHPLFLTVFAFIVTTVIGGFYDQILSDRERERVQQERNSSLAEEREEEALSELKGFVTLAYERTVRTGMLRSAIKRGSLKEAQTRKSAYDEIFVRWNAELPTNLMTIRSLIGKHAQKTAYESAVERSILPAFSKADLCLTRAFDAFVQSQETGAAFAPPDCNGGESDLTWSQEIAVANTTARSCTYTIMAHIIFEIRALRNQSVSFDNDESEKALNEVRDRASKWLETECPEFGSAAQ